MNLLLSRHLWGTPAPYLPALQQYKEQGFSVIESSLLYLAEPKQQFIEQLNMLDLRWIPMVFTEGKTVADHIDSLKQQIDEVIDEKPLFINAHSGRDAFTFSESMEFFTAALQIEKDYGIAIAHETHRSRILFNPWITRDILLELPELQLCCDYSHWVTVCERLIDDQLDILALCAKHALHIHARVGHEQGPQVSDPRAPEFAAHVAAHEKWWKMIWLSQHERKFESSTLTPEFGPWPYLPCSPYSQEPLASQADICLWQAQRQRDNFTQLFNDKIQVASSY
jgi:hypothetical protein